MKKLFVLVFAAFSFTAMAQEGAPELPKDADGKVVYQEVVEVPGATAEQLYDRVNKWLNAHYNGFASKVIKSDKTAGVIEYKNKFSKFKMVKGKRLNGGFIQYHCTINFKNGKIRYTIDEIVSQEPGAPGIEKWYDTTDVQYDGENWPYFLQQVKDYMEALTKGIREESIKAEEEGNDDW